MLSKILICLSISVTCSLFLGSTEKSYVTNGIDSWVGMYEYVATFPHATDESFNYFISYSVNIYKEDSNYFARIINDGWFTQTRILAEVTGDRFSIDIRFLETLPGDNLYGYAERFNKYDVLWTFEQNASGISTVWLSMRKEHPVLFEYDSEIKGLYFKRLEI